MNDTINFKCPVCGAFPLEFEVGKRSADNTHCAVCSTCKHEVDNYKALMYLEKEHVTITKQEYYDLRAKAEVIDSIAQSQGDKNIFEELLSDYGVALVTYNNNCREIYKEIFGE